MLDYTKAALKQIVEDFKKIDFVRSVLTQIVYLAYLMYAIFARSGIFAVNLTLFIISALYFAFFLYMTGQENANKKVTKFAATLFKRCKQVIKLFTLGVMLYGVWLAAERVTPLSMILSSLMIVGWVLQILFEIIIKFFAKRANLIIEGLEADYEGMTKPARSVGNFFKKVAGKEVEVKEPTKARLILDEKVNAAREERENERLEQKYLKKTEKKQAKNRKKAEKQRKKAAKKQTAETEEVAVSKSK